MKNRWETQRPCDVADGPLIGETQHEEQAIGGIQLVHGAPKRTGQLIAADPRIGGVRSRSRELVWFDLVGDEILEPPACNIFSAPRLVFASRATVFLTKMIEHQPTRDDHQPRGEFGLSVGHVRAKTPASIVAQRLEHEGVTIHCRIVVTSGRAANVQDYIAVRRDELRPSVIAFRTLARVMETRERERQVWRMQGFAYERNRGEWFR